ncbi:NAD(P)-dependent glycerol-3-phosphate dehydrogenase [Alsobacter sp. SYSU M60028]|uniref:Glycerol-3-phosphate dehydrogenase [NAD(P)+] n=1 Tax=Alsobacter ponti TaxID=2962936 RepID=A0ABT1LB76_9HYPH|nr:NAD(P)H-dependent glycerol-3-phosphate dehydrogenase [Alsobacter ponti]MCP8938737.1 NAD(P)-dependent glycerol-3-phosphate dehydrogenase [Alsobacter ponti]
MPRERFGSIAVLGGGAWGTALANAAARGGRRVTLWARDAGQAQEMAATRENATRLPGVRLADSVAPTADIAAIAEARAVLLAVPAQSLRAVASLAAAHMRQGAAAVICAKGIERDTGRFMSEIVAETLPHAVPAVLSGPSFAADVARGLPTAVVLACADAALAQGLAAALSSPSFRVYHGDDVRGVEIGGAAKNVLAIAAGIAAGMGLGESAKAALTTRGFAELSRFARVHGARPETLMGLSGLGDLILTCGSLQSRNFAFGHDLGRGAPVAAAGGGKLAEGAFTARVLAGMAAERSVDMPIAQAVDAVLEGRLSIRAAMDALMTRPLRAEHGDAPFSAGLD